VPALASIPIMLTASDHARRRRLLRYTWGGTAAAVILTAAGIHFFVRPLDVLWLILIRRFGV